MRLIDADALKENWFYTTDTKIKVVEVAEIDGAPTITDVSSVVHGRWAKIDNPGYSPFDGSPPYIFLCDQCIGVAQSDSQFCPHCGARMDLEEPT